MENEVSKNEKWNSKRLERNARKRERRQQAKLENSEIVKEESAQRQERRLKEKSENPEIVKIESAKRQERRLKAKSLNPEKYKAFLLSEKQKRETHNRQILNDVFDHMFEENKHTFPTPVSKNLWEKLKKEEIDYLLNPTFFPEGNAVWELLEDRKEHLNQLRENPDHPCAPSMIFYIKTLVHRAKDNGRKLTPEEIEWINSVEISSDSHEIKKKPYDPEKKKQQNKEYYAKTKLNQKTVNLNLRFIKADPNKVLSIDEITNNPFVSNYPIREQHKIDLWKADKNLSDLNLWQKQREDYEMEVEELSIEYKEEFLKGK